MTIQSQIAQANYQTRGSIHPGHVTRPETVTDVELRELLEHFTASINTPAPIVNREPRLDLRANAPAPRVPQLTAPVRTIPQHHLGISRNITASIISLAIAAGIGWLLYANPGLLDGELKMSAHQASFMEAVFPERAVPAPAGGVMANAQTKPTFSFLSGLK